MKEDDIKENIFQYLKNLSDAKNGDEISDDFKLLESGLIDSLGLFKLVSYLEDNLNIQIQPSNITVENFSTPKNIIQMIRSLRNE